MMLLPLLACASSLFPVPPQQPEEAPPGVESVRIWNEAPHSAFVDLIRFRDRFYCSFREGTGHVPGDTGGDGTIRVIASPDGLEWSSVASIAEEGVDLRDPKMSVTPDGRIMIVVGGSVYEGRKFLSRLPRASFSDEEGTEFSDAAPLRIDPAIAGSEDWLWRVTWHGDTAWGGLYQPGAGSDRVLQLVSSKDGITWEHVHTLALEGQPNESTIRFLPDGRMVMVVRRASGGGLVGTAAPPFTEWTFHPLARRLGGPNFVQLPSGRWILGTREYGANRQYRTILTGLELDGTSEKRLELESGGDTSYPGMVVHGDSLWVAYYSSHEAKTAIYLARVPLDRLAAEPEGRD